MDALGWMESSLALKEGIAAMHSSLRDVCRCYRPYRLIMLHCISGAAMIINTRWIRTTMLAKSIPAAERDSKLCGDATSKHSNESPRDESRC